MNKIDKFIKETTRKILKEGSVDENPRPIYSDGTPAHTKYITQVVEEYDLSKGEFPISTLRPITWKGAINEILAIYQSQTYTQEGFEKHFCRWWIQWLNDEGNIGRAYAYNLESHRPHEMTKESVKQDVRIVDESYDCKNINGFSGEGRLGNYELIENYSETELNSLHDIWENMFLLSYKTRKPKMFVHKDWYTFKQFLKDVRYLPQYHLAKEVNFSGYTLTPFYYSSNCYSKDTCAFLDNEDYSEIQAGTITPELSRNQVNELIKNLKEDPYSRRHMLSFYNWANQNKKMLVECAFQSLITVRNVDGEKYLDWTLVQRSSDFLIAGMGINQIQYVALQMMIAHECGYKVGKFIRFTQNVHLYDRHIEQAHEILKRTPSTKQPKLVLNADGKSFYEITIDDFELIDYEPVEPQLKFDLGI